MSFNLLALRVYSRDGKSETVRFNPTGLSFVVGGSGTGKSSLLQIVDYCLMSKRCGIPRGVVREKTSAVGILIESDKRIAVVRAMPEGERTTSDRVSLRAGRSVELPELVPSDWNSNRAHAKELLSSFCGIDATPVLTNWTAEDDEDDVAANIRHCAPMLFQQQDVIASRNTTFSGLEDYFKKSHFLDALAYFLKAYSMNVVVGRRELSRLQLEARRHAAVQNEKRSRTTGGLSRGNELLRESIRLGIATANDGSVPDSELIRRLEQVAVELEGKRIDDRTDRELLELQDAEQKLKRSLSMLRIEAASLKKSLETNRDFEKVHRDQLDRLSVDELLPDPELKTCPLCNGGSINAESTRSAIQRALAGIRGIGKMPDRIASAAYLRLQEVESSIDTESRRLEEQKKTLREMIQSPGSSLGSVRQMRERDRLLGAIREYLEAMSSAADVSLSSEPNNEGRIRELLNTVGDGALRAAVQNAEDNVGARMTDAISKLGGEYQQNSLRLNIRRSLSIEVKIGGEWLALSELGSGANWLLCHVAMMMGLHETLIGRGSVVP